MRETDCLAPLDSVANWGKVSEADMKCDLRVQPPYSEKQDTGHQPDATIEQDEAFCVQRAAPSARMGGWRWLSVAL